MKTEVIEHRYEFTPEEKNEMAHRVTRLEIDLLDLEAQKKAAADEFKAKIDPIYDEVQYLSRCVQNGHEPRNYTCRIERDTARQVRVYRDVQSEQVIKEEPFTAEDLQGDLPGMDGNEDRPADEGNQEPPAGDTQPPTA